MVKDPLRVYDGFSGLLGGCDQGRRPNLIGTDQCANAENLVFRGGAPTTRPGIMQLPVVYQNDVLYNPGGQLAGPGDDPDSTGTVVAFTTGLFQCASYYSYGDTQCFMASIGGRLFKCVPTLTTLEVTEIPIPVRRNRSNIPRAYMLQADMYHITQDGEAAPIIFDGVTARRAIEDEIFTGTIMAYGQGRIVLVQDRLIYFGDIYNGKGNGAADLLGFTETKFLNEGFPSALPSDMGLPTGAAFFPQQDTATGTGNLLIFGEHGAESFFLNLPRSSWKDSTFQQTALLGIGARGDRALVMVNGDLWFRASDGWRSYRQARAEINQLAQVPLSTGVRRFTDSDTEMWLDFSSAIHFDNRMIMTCSPQSNGGNGNRLFHNGLLSLDFDLLSSFGSATQPAWDGHWAAPFSPLSLRNPQIFQLVNGDIGSEPRAFFFGMDADENTSFYEITKTSVHDFYGAIPWEMVTRSFNFKSEFNQTELWGIDVWVDDILEPDSSPVNIVAQYRADQKPEFQPWGTFKPLSSDGVPGQIFPSGVPKLKTGCWPRKSLGIPPTTCDEVTGETDSRGFEFQVKLQATGHCCLRKLRLHAKTLIERENADCT